MRYALDLYIYTIYNSINSNKADLYYHEQVTLVLSKNFVTKNSIYRVLNIKGINK